MPLKLPLLWVMLLFFAAGATWAVDLSDMGGFPPMDAVAFVEIRTIDHSLLGSDIRRIEHGAQPPLVPFTARLYTTRIYPEARPQRFFLESIVQTNWMPASGDKGLIALRFTKGEYVPAGMFPVEAYYPEVSVAEAPHIEFPPDMGGLVPTDTVWEYACDKIDASGKSSVEQEAAKWEKRLYEAQGPVALLALLFLLGLPSVESDWNDLMKAILSETEMGIGSLPHETTIDGLSLYAPDHQVGKIFDAALDELTHLAGTGYSTGLGQAMLRFALRHPEAKRAEALRTVLSAGAEGKDDVPPLIESMGQLEPFLEGFQGAALEAVLHDMLIEPWRFPFLSTRYELERLWTALAACNHPSLAPYLRAFLETPSLDLNRLSLSSADLQRLVALATELINDAAAAGGT